MGELKPIPIGYEAAKPPKGKQGFGGAGVAFWLIPLQIPWYFAVVLAAWFVLGDPEPTRPQLCVLFLVAAFPALGGTIWEVAMILAFIMARKPVDKPSLTVAILVLIGCCLESAVVALALHHL